MVVAILATAVLVVVVKVAVVVVVVAAAAATVGEVVMVVAVVLAVVVVAKAGLASKVHCWLRDVCDMNGMRVTWMWRACVWGGGPIGIMVILQTNTNANKQPSRQTPTQTNKQTNQNLQMNPCRRIMVVVLLGGRTLSCRTLVDGFV